MEHLKKKKYKFNLLYLKHRRSSTVGQSQTFVKPVKLDEFHGKKKKKKDSCLLTITVKASLQCLLVGFTLSTE